jgi:hypothetical protein
MYAGLILLSSASAGSLTRMTTLCEGITEVTVGYRPLRAAPRVDAVSPSIGRMIEGIADLNSSYIMRDG